MSYYRTCPDCGATLDPGEQCDCIKEKAATSAANTDIQYKVNPFLYGQNGLYGQNDPLSRISSNLSNLSTRTA